MSKGNRYVIGDIHGCIATFRKMIQENILLTKKDTLYLVGDYIDRGPDPKAVIDYILELKKGSFNVFPIMGNHEYMLIQALESEEYFDLWTLNGCSTTLLSFGIDQESIDKRESVLKIPEHYLDFLNGLPYYAETKSYFIVHAGLGKSIEDPLEDVYSLLWTRAEIYNKKFLGNRKLIHGHTPISLEAIKDRVYDPEEMFLNLDGGCVYKGIEGMGNLVALDLDNRDLHVQRNIDYL